jgi:tetratricopeptide (TPR) repeat protein
MADRSDAEEALLRGETARREKRSADAADAFADAVACFRRVADPARLAHALTRQAQIARDVKDFSLALRLQEEAVTLARGLGADSFLARVIRHLADILQESGRASAAVPLYVEMMELYERAPDTPALEMANAARSVACNMEALGDQASAVALWRGVRCRYEALDDVFRNAYGMNENPGVMEADRRLAALSSHSG